jgi:predicted RecA/RadA family phage recombinase
MALQTNGSRIAKLDMARSYFERRQEYPLTAATTLVEEGQLAVMGGTTAVQVTTSAGLAVTEVPAGVFLFGEIDANTFVHWETGVVPAALTYTLKFNNLVTSAFPYSAPGLAEAYVYIVATGTEIPVTAAAAAPGDCMININTGVMTFNALQFGGALPMAGVTFAIRYRWNLTTVQSREIVRQSAVGRGSEVTYRKAIVGRGDGCRVFTSLRC